MIYNWTTEKGANVELTVNKTTKIETESYYCDGVRTEIKKPVKSTEYNIKINSTEYNKAAFDRINGQSAISFDVSGKKGAVILPENILHEMLKPTPEELEAQQFISERNDFANKFYSENSDL